MKMEDDEEERQARILAGAGARQRQRRRRALEEMRRWCEAKEIELDERRKRLEERRRRTGCEVQEDDTNGHEEQNNIGRHEEVDENAARMDAEVGDGTPEPDVIMAMSTEGGAEGADVPVDGDGTVIASLPSVEQDEMGAEWAATAIAELGPEPAADDDESCRIVETSGGEESLIMLPILPLLE